MGKYKVGDELVIVTDPTKESKQLKDLTHLKKDGDFVTLSWGIRIQKVEYDNPNITLTYINAFGELNKVFAVCNDVDNFDEELLLEKALLKAFQNEIINITVLKNKRNKS